MILSNALLDTGCSRARASMIAEAPIDCQTRHVEETREHTCLSARSCMMFAPTLASRLFTTCRCPGVSKGLNPMFEGFHLEMIEAGEAVLRVRYGGSGPPLLLLHGHPQTHVM